MVKIRLARNGMKKVAVYRIVVQESSQPRNGKTIDDLGYYNPNTDPATVHMDLEKAKDWMSKGAQPTNAVRKLMKMEQKAQKAKDVQ